MRRVMVITALIIALVAVCARPALPPRFGGDVVIRLHDKIIVINPAMAVRPDEFTVILSVYDTLVRCPEKNKMTPLLLEKPPETSDDGLIYYFKLKPGVTFHDGSALDSEDVQNTVRLLIKNRRSPYGWIFNDIAGAESYRRGKSAALEGFKIVDEQRFEIRLARKNKNFAKYLCFPAAAVVPSTESDFKKPMGTGPFRISSFKPNGRIVLAAFDRYHNGRPFIDHAIFEPVREDETAVTEFKAGNIHITDIPVDGLRAEAASLETMSGAMNILYFLDVDTETQPLNTDTGRENISRAVNRIDLLNTVLNGRGRTETNFKTGTAKKTAAKKELTLRYPDAGAAYKLAAEKIRRDLRAAGLQISLEPSELRALFHFPQSNPPDMVLRALPVMLDLPESVENVLYSPNLETEHAALALRINAKNAERDARDKNLAIYLFSQPTAYVRAAALQGFSIGRFNNIDLQNIHIGTISE